MIRPQIKFRIRKIEMRNKISNNQNSVAYIDASNLKFGIKQSKWKLDYKSFRSWLRDKFGVSRAVLFIGLLPDNSEFYNYLQRIGYDIFVKKNQCANYYLGSV